MTLSDRGRAALTRTLKAAAGVPVTYTRKADAGVLALTAVPGLTTFTSAELPGRVEVANRDYQLDPADLVAGGARFEPALGDTIAEVIDGAACVFEVQTPESGEPAARWGSQWRGLLRVHTKQVR